MLEVLPQSTERALAVKASGKLSDDDYQKVLIPRLEEMIQRQGPASFMLVCAGDFQGWEAKAAWDDAAFGFKHRKDFAKMAVVGAPEWVNWGAKVGALFISGQLKTFPAGQEQAAWQWVTS
ncbi:MAG: STAS/SEC14 domain-containing protein [Thermodesulfobacteriota bacterium]